MIGTYHEDTGCAVDGEDVAYDMINSTSDCTPKFLTALLISHALGNETYLLDFHSG
jgi:hypothetical protein